MEEDEGRIVREESEPGPLEAEARRLRDVVYGQAIGSGWNGCRENWMADIRWLRKMAKKQQQTTQGD